LDRQTPTAIGQTDGRSSRRLMDCHGIVLAFGEDNFLCLLANGMPPKESPATPGWIQSLPRFLVDGTHLDASCQQLVIVIVLVVVLGRFVTIIVVVVVVVVVTLVVMVWHVKSGAPQVFLCLDFMFSHDPRKCDTLGSFVASLIRWKLVGRPTDPILAECLAIQASRFE
jgi:hypothetical protein